MESPMTRTISGTPANGTPAADRLRRLVSTCPGCGLRFDPATARRNPAASENELATAIQAAEDVVDPHAAPKCQQKPISADSSFAGDAAARAAAVGYAMLERAMSRPRPDGPDAERFDEMTGPFPADDVAQSPERDRAQPHDPAAETPRKNGTAPERRGGDQNAAGTIAAPVGGKDAPDRSVTTAEATIMLRMAKLTAAALEANLAWIENRTGESDEEILRDRRLYRAKDAAEGALRDFVNANLAELRQIGGMA